MWCVVYPDELYHHGILGQKWGVRRFQNKDGSLTSAGKKRYGSEGSDSREKKPINGKKIAVAVGATVAGVAAVGLYAKYHNEINAALKQVSANAKNVGANVSDTVGRKASSSLTKAGMIGRQFASDQKGKLITALNNGIKEGSDELVKAGLVAVAGIGAKKISEAKERYEQTGSKNAVAEMLFSSGNKAIDSFTSSVKSGSSNNSNGNKANGKAGATVGKDLAQKLGPARQEHYSPSEQKRYDRLFQDNNKVKGNDEVRLTVKALKRAGYSIDQIETYLNGV